MDNGYSNNLFRACLVIDAAGGTNLYMLREYSQHQYLQYLPWPTNTPVAGFDTGYCMYRESYHWGPLQVQNLSTSDMTQFTDSDYIDVYKRQITLRPPFSVCRSCFVTANCAAST